MKPFNLKSFFPKKHETTNFKQDIFEPYKI